MLVLAALLALGGVAVAQCQNPMMPVNDQAVWVYLERGPSESDTIAVRRSVDGAGTITEESAGPEGGAQRYRCEAGALLPLSSSVSMPGLDVQVLAAHGVALAGPQHWRVGGNWQYSLDVQASMKGALRLTGKGNVDVRFRVVAQETLSVPAGVFDAFRVEVTRTMNGHLGLLPYQSVTRQTVWYAPGVGLIRSDEQGQVRELLEMRGD